MEHATFSQERPFASASRTLDQLLALFACLWWMGTSVLALSWSGYAHFLLGAPSLASSLLSDVAIVSLFAAIVMRHVFLYVHWRALAATGASENPARTTALAISSPVCPFFWFPAHVRLADPTNQRLAALHCDCRPFSRRVAVWYCVSSVSLVAAPFAIVGALIVLVLLEGVWRASNPNALGWSLPVTPTLGLFPFLALNAALGFWFALEQRRTLRSLAAVSNRMSDSEPAPLSS